MTTLLLYCLTSELVFFYVPCSSRNRFFLFFVVFFYVIFYKLKDRRMHFSFTLNNFLTLLCACTASSDVVTTQGKGGQRKDFLCEWRTDTSLGAVECVVKLENRFAIREARPRSDMRQRLPIQFTEKSMWICSEGETWRLLSMRDTRISSIYSSEPVTQFLMFVTSNRTLGLTLVLRLLTSTAALLVRSVVRESNGGQSGSDHLGSDLHGVATRIVKPCLKICKH